MKIVRDSLVKKAFVHFFVVGALISGAAYYFFFVSDREMNVWIFSGGLGIMLFYFLCVYYFGVVRPFNVVLAQIQALLAGKAYRRIYTNRIDEVGVIAHFFNQVTTGLGSFSSQMLERDRMHGELTIASQLQKEILPPSSPDVNGLHIVAKNRPASELGGDSFNFFTVKGNTFIYIGDVTGHGVAGGLVMTMANSLISVFADMFASPYEIMVNVNKYIKKHVKRTMFMTLVMLKWDNVKQQLTYVGAGHEHILIYRKDSGVCEAVLSGGVALGMVPDNSKLISEKEIILNEGDFVILYTDGITEAHNPEGELFGLERLKQSIIEHAPKYSANGLNYHIATDVSQFMANAVQQDDMTLIVIHKNSQNLKEDLEDKSTTWQT
jgi:hypothetical protein